MKKLAVLILSIISFFLVACKKELHCNNVVLTDLRLVFNDKLYKQKYPLKNINVNIFEKGLNGDSIVPINIIDTVTSNSSYRISFDNLVKKSTRIEILIGNKKNILSDFEIRKKTYRTFLWQSYEECSIVSYKLNGIVVNESHFDLNTGY